MKNEPEYIKNTSNFRKKEKYAGTKERLLGLLYANVVAAECSRDTQAGEAPSGLLEAKSVRASSIASTNCSALMGL
jgi:hypothetical protein